MKYKKQMIRICSLVLTCLLLLQSAGTVRISYAAQQETEDASGDAEEDVEEMEEEPEEEENSDDEDDEKETYYLTLKSLGKGSTTVTVGDRQYTFDEKNTPYGLEVEVEEGEIVTFYATAEDGWTLAMAALSTWDGHYLPIDGYHDYDLDLVSESKMYLVGLDDLSGFYQGEALSFEMTENLTLFTDYAFRFRRIVRDTYIGVVTSNESTTNFFAKGDGSLYVSEEEMLENSIRSAFAPKFRLLAAAAAPQSVTAGSLYGDTWTASSPVAGHSNVYVYTTNEGGKKADFETTQSVLTTLAKNYSRYLGTAYNNNGYGTAKNGPWNCDGFVDRVLLDSGGAAINANLRWHTYVRTNHVESKTFYATSESALMSALADTKASGLVPGAIIWFWDGSQVNAYNINSTMLSTGIASTISNYHHVGFYIGNDLDDVLFTTAGKAVNKSVEVAAGKNTKFWHSGPTPVLNGSCKSSVNDEFGYPEENHITGFSGKKTSYVATVFYPNYGGIKLQKRWNYNSKRLLSEDRAEYYVRDAVYAVYTDQACSKWTGKYLVCDEKGAAQSDMDYAPGTYYVKEVQSATGGERSTKVYKVKVTAGEYVTVKEKNSDPSTTQETEPYVFDAIKRVALTMSKKTKAGSEKIASANPKATLAGAVYTVYSDAALKNAIATMKTDAKGNASLSKDMSLGTYYIKETKPSPGYLLNEEVIKLKFYDKKADNAYNASTGRYRNYTHPLYCDMQVKNPDTGKWSSVKTTKLSLTSDLKDISKKSRYAFSFTSEEVPEEIEEEPPELPKTGSRMPLAILIGVAMIVLAYRLDKNKKL